jgi:hypothetical protein
MASDGHGLDLLCVRSEYIIPARTCQRLLSVLFTAEESRPGEAIGKILTHLCCVHAKYDIVVYNRKKQRNRFKKEIRRHINLIQTEEIQDFTICIKQKNSLLYAIPPSAFLRSSLSLSISSSTQSPS